MYLVGSDGGAVLWASKPGGKLLMENAIDNILLNLNELFSKNHPISRLDTSN